MRSEFEFIQNIKGRHQLKVIGDDCAVIPLDSQSDQLFTVDLLIENIDFRLAWTTPTLLGHKALAVSLSDIAAMGGTPKYAMLSIGIPEKLWKTSFLDEFYEGWHTLASEFDVEVIGGDISRAPSELTIDSIVVGEAPRGRAIRRSGANPGDSIFVTGKLGGAALGLLLLENGEKLGGGSGDPLQMAIAKQLKPMPQITFGKLLLQNELASALIDLSDGLSSDLTHVCGASDVGAIVDESKLPIANGATLEMALGGGEDFELLFTSPLLEIKGATKIGTINERSQGLQLLTSDGPRPLHAEGFRHF